MINNNVSDVTKFCVLVKVVGTQASTGPKNCIDYDKAKEKIFVLNICHVPFFGKK